MNTRLALITGGLVIGAAFGGVAKGRLPSRIPIPPVERHQLAINEGYEPLVNVELEPSAVLKDSSGEALEYGLSVAPRKGSSKDVALRYSIEMVSAEGVQLQKPSLSQAINVAARGGHAKTLVTPTALGDGYFLVRAQVAAADGTEDTLQIAERYFRSQGGTVVPVTADEYFQNSNAGLARRLP